MDLGNDLGDGLAGDVTADMVGGMTMLTMEGPGMVGGMTMLTMGGLGEAALLLVDGGKVPTAGDPLTASEKDLPGDVLAGGELAGDVLTGDVLAGGVLAISL